MNRFYLLPLMTCFWIASTVQAQEYQFSQYNQPYQELSNPTVLATNWPTMVTHPMTSPFLLHAFNQAVDFDAFVGGTPFFIFGNSTRAMAIDPMISLEGQAFDSTSSISYQVDSVPGQRVLKVQWKKVGMANHPGRWFNVQMWLEEVTHDVTFHYGPNNTGTLSFPVNGGPKCGLWELSADFSSVYEYHTLEGDPFSPTYTQSSNNGLTNIPGNGQMYIFENTTRHPLDTGIPSGIINSAEWAAMKVYPNPAQDELMLSGTGWMGQTVRITDAQGKLVFERQLSGDRDRTVPITGWPVGVYFISTSEDISRTRKFIKH